MAGSNMGQVRPGAGPGGSSRRIDTRIAADCGLGMGQPVSRSSLPQIREDRMLFHVDVNSAFLSWEAVYRLQHGDRTDLRTIPSVIAGDESLRKGIVLAGSLPAKRYGIHAGETLWQARRKCPDLVVAPPAQPLYLACSQALVEVLSAYTRRIERYSIDECFLDLTGTDCLNNRNPEAVAIEIRDRVRQELGFTVNIGISVNKLLAKTASGFEKPNRVHTLFPNEIPNKLWTLPVRDLFLVGPRVAPRLYRLNIFSIGHLAQAEPALLERHLGCLGPLLWQFANGYDNASVLTQSAVPKAIGNSVSTPYNVDTEREALLFLHAVTETAASRLRAQGMQAQEVTIGLRSVNLAYTSHQKRLLLPTDHTATLSSHTARLFREHWTGEPLRHVGISLSDLTDGRFEQTTLFGGTATQKARALDTHIDSLRKRYGPQAVLRANFVASGIPPMAGGPQGSSPVGSRSDITSVGQPEKTGIAIGPWTGIGIRRGRDRS